MSIASPEKFILCLACRATFAEADVTGPCCPACGDRGVPADTRDAHAISLTDHEWRVLFIWAERWAELHDAAPRDDVNMLQVLRGIMAEARRQQPTLPNLSLLDDIQGLVTMAGRPGRLVKADGSEVAVIPATKH